MLKGIRVYYLENGIFWSAVENYIYRKVRISCGWDKDLKMYYIREE